MNSSVLSTGKKIFSRSQKFFILFPGNPARQETRVPNEELVELRIANQPVLIEQRNTILLQTPATLWLILQGLFKSYKYQPIILFGKLLQLVLSIKKIMTNGY